VKEDYHKWHTLYLNREFNMLVFGHAGIPVVLFPTAQEKYYTYKDNGLINSVSNFIEEGKIKIYTPDGIDNDSWYNYSIHPADRVKTHIAYENVILHDVVEFAIYESDREKVIVGGCDFGGYHAYNFAFKHPDKVEGIISMGAFFDIKRFIYGYYDDNCYFNNPPDYMPNLEDPWYLDRIKEMKIILGSGEWDNNLDENKRMSDILNWKQIPHLLDIKQAAGSDWGWWREIFPEYIKMMTGN
jgi:esterase/lipase superfamily enzyme